MSHDFFDLTVAEKQVQTPDASVIYLDLPAGREGLFAFIPGQYITLKVDINGQEERRAYSLCTSPDDQKFGFCVKRLAGGKVSNYLLDSLKTGQILSVMAPEGRFVAKTNSDNRKTYYLIGAGSGITPLMSITRKVLEDEPGSTVHLIYGNRSEDTIIFKAELEEMEKRYSGQFTVNHILSQPALKKASGLKGLFGKNKPTWRGRIGRIDTKELNLFLAERESHSTDNQYFLCGPGGMIDTVEKELLRNGIKSSYIHTERFVTEVVADADRIQGNPGAVKVTLDGKVVEIHCEGGKTILETLIAEGENPPYSCASGACSTCIAKVTKGEVKMDVNHALDPDEVEEGYVLTCQSHPVTADVELSYDE